MDAARTQAEKTINEEKEIKSFKNGFTCEAGVVDE